MPMSHIIDYLRPGPLTEVDTAHAWALQDLPSDPTALCTAAEALVVRPAEARALGLSARRLEEQNIRSVSGLVEVLTRLFSARLHSPRPPSARVVGTSRHVAVLACALLRASGFAARVRAGFVTRHGHMTGDELWITEHWDSFERCWIRPLPVALRREATAGSSEPLGFLSGGEAWREYRKGQYTQATYDYTETDPTRCALEISSTTVRDLAALCQVEVLPGDVWGRVAQVHEGRMPAAFDNLIDVTASVCARGDATDLARLFSTRALGVPQHMLS
ncbi:transglutaminase [Streptomyces fagopyri]|uniref:transglutaminase n=1 Tax=Streptomyces fagopyri TaxID=2662397 RepID=UPI0036CC9598